MLTKLERCLLNDYQRDFPLTPTPYAEIARALGVSEEEVLERLRALRATGAISRVGAVLRPRRLGASTLAAMAVPEERLEEVAAIVSARSEVNHNYEREHRYNLWFVAQAGNETELAQLLADVELRTGITVLALPMLVDYHIDLGFELQWT
jgi:DNA-binding Lrp family transcriptional regulator